MKNKKAFYITLALAILLVSQSITRYSAAQDNSRLNKTFKQQETSVISQASRLLLNQTKAEKEDVRAVRSLLKSRANVNVHDWVAGVEYNTPLQYAAQNRHWRTMKLLIRAGADVNPKIPFGDEHYYSPLMHSAAFGQKEIVRLLLRKGANVNGAGYQDYTALMLAALYNRKANAEILLQHGADVYAKTYFEHNTALDIAKEANHKEMVRLLRKWMQKPQRLTFWK